MPLIDTCLGPLAVDDAGSGPPVVLWHCLFFDRTIWAPLALELRRDFRVVLIDGPGHGGSPPPLRRYSLEDCGRAALEIMDALGLERAVVGGISWGGMVALRTALLAPQRVRSLLLLDTTADAATLFERLRSGALAEVVERTGFPSFVIGAVFALTYAQAARRRLPSLRRDLEQRFARLDRGAAAHATRAVLRDRTDVRAALFSLRMPALVMVGSEDRTFPVAHAERLAASLPRARLERLDGLGHLSIVEAPQRLTTLIAGFLREVQIPAEA